MNTEWLQTVADRYAAAKYARLTETSRDVTDLVWLQTFADRYAQAKYERIGEAAIDHSFMHCGKCAVPVFAFRHAQQLACYTCVCFLCAQCPVCACGADGVLVADADKRVGRLTEHCTRSIIYGCNLCDAFFFRRDEYDVHCMCHELADPVPPTLTVPPPGSPDGGRPHCSSCFSGHAAGPRDDGIGPDWQTAV